MCPSIVFSKLQTMKSTQCSHTTFKNEIIENISTHCGNGYIFVNTHICLYVHVWVLGHATKLSSYWGTMFSKGKDVTGLKYYFHVFLFH